MCDHACRDDPFHGASRNRRAARLHQARQRDGCLPISESGCDLLAQQNNHNIARPESQVREELSRGLCVRLLLLSFPPGASATVELDLISPAVYCNLPLGSSRQKPGIIPGRKRRHSSCECISAPSVSRDCVRYLAHVEGFAGIWKAPTEIVGLSSHLGRPGRWGRSLESARTLLP